MELLQNFLPQRVPSNVDWLLNIAGAALGAAARRWLVHALGGVDRWQALRERWFIARSAGGLALLLLWPLGLLFPAPVPLGLGQVLAAPAGGRLRERSRARPALDWVEPLADAAPRSAPLSRRAASWPPSRSACSRPAWSPSAIARPGWRRLVLVAGARGARRWRRRRCRRR